MSFPGRVEVDYVDLKRRPEEAKTIEAAFLVTGVYQPPLIYINGEAKFAAQFPADQIKEEVAKAIALKTN